MRISWVVWSPWSTCRRLSLQAGPKYTGKKGSLAGSAIERREFNVTIMDRSIFTSAFFISFATNLARVPLVAYDTPPTFTFLPQYHVFLPLPVAHAVGSDNSHDNAPSDGISPRRRRVPGSGGLIRGSDVVIRVLLQAGLLPFPLLERRPLSRWLSAHRRSSSAYCYLSLPPP